MRGQVLQHCSVLTGGMELSQRGRREAGHAQQSLTLVLFLSFSIQMDCGKTDSEMGPCAWLLGKPSLQCIFLCRITVNSPP